MKRTLLALVGLVFAASTATAEDLSNIQWVTNMDDPPIGDPSALKGGTLYTYTTAYPLTFRPVGPNSNDGFASYRRRMAFMEEGLVTLHPVTDNWIPWLATHWAVASDSRTVYYKLDPDVRWSDGEPVTADDYVFAWKFLQREDIVDPFWNEYTKDYYEEVAKLDEYTIKIVGKFESWRPIADFNLFPLPKHFIEPGPDWVKDANNVFPLNLAPYQITEAVTNQYVVYTRQDEWWGDKKHYMQGLFNPKKVHIWIIGDPDAGFDRFRKGDLSFYQVFTAKKWAQEMEFDAVKKGWVHKKRIFIDYPQGLYGFAMNLEVPLFQNKDFRKAIQYLFNFDQINDKLMFNAYYRAVSNFVGTEYANPDLKPYGFDPRKAREHLDKAGFTQKGSDGILTRSDGTRASFTLTYGAPGLEKHMTVIKQVMQRFGVEMNLRLMERGTAFNRGLEREYEVMILSRTAGFWPGPHQYYASIFKETRNNNNVFAFGTAYTDSLIDIYRFNSDKSARIAAMHELDAIIQDEAFYVPFWYAPFIRLLYWDYVQWPETFLPKRIEQLTDWWVYWIDTKKEAALKEAMKNNRAYPEDTIIDVDPYGIQERIQQVSTAASGDSDRM